MKKIITVFTFTAIFASVSLFSFVLVEKNIEGIWQGTLKVQGIELRIIFKIKKDKNDALTATMDSPDQGAANIPLDTVKLEGSNLFMELKMAGGIYEGSISADGKKIEGTWKQGGLDFPLVLEHTDKVAELKRPQEPKKPFPYNEEEVAYENEKDEIKLAGTLTLPQGEGPYPAVLLISGSGAQDRNEGLLGHKPFLLLSDYLTRRHISVLRVDDRGVGGSTGNLSESTSIDLAEDVLSGIRFLKTRKEIDPERIGLIGHSEGGIIAPIVASKSEDIAFIILMAGTGVTGEEILYLQGELIARANGATEEDIQKARLRQELIFKVLKREKDNDSAEKALRSLYEEDIAGMDEEEKKEAEVSDEVFKASLKKILNPWFRFFLTFDPKTALNKVKCPVLAIIGEKDLQVPPEQNLKEIEKALKQGGNEDYTIKELPGLNHLFQTAETGAPSEYGKIEETISPSALKLIGDWLLEHVKKK